MRPSSVFGKSACVAWIVQAALLVASPVHAQSDKDHRLKKVTTLLRAAVGTNVRVRLQNGHLVGGFVQAVDGTSVKLVSSAGTRKLALADVVQVILSPKGQSARTRNATSGNSKHDQSLKISSATTQRLLNTAKKDNLKLSGPATRRLLNSAKKDNLELSSPATRRLLNSAQRRNLLLKYRRLEVSGARLRNWGLAVSITGLVLTAIGGGLAGASSQTRAVSGGIALSAIGGTAVLSGLIMLFWGQAQHARGIDMGNTIRLME